jgi:hypothetical protein
MIKLFIFIIIIEECRINMANKFLPILVFVLNIQCIFLNDLNHFPFFSLPEDLRYEVIGFAGDFKSLVRANSVNELNELIKINKNFNNIALSNKAFNSLLNTFFKNKVHRVEANHLFKLLTGIHNEKNYNQESKIARLLIKYKLCDVDALLPSVQLNLDKDYFFSGLTLLFVANQFTDLNLISFLIKSGANINVQDDYGMTPLMHSVLHNNETVLEKLLNAKANPDIQDRNGETALMKAIDNWEYFPYSATLHPLSKCSDMKIRNLSNEIPLSMIYNKWNWYEASGPELIVKRSSARDRRLEFFKEKPLSDLYNEIQGRAIGLATLGINIILLPVAVPIVTITRLRQL